MGELEAKDPVSRPKSLRDHLKTAGAIAGTLLVASAGVAVASDLSKPKQPKSGKFLHESKNCEADPGAHPPVGPKIWDGRYIQPFAVLWDGERYNGHVVFQAGNGQLSVVGVIHKHRGSHREGIRIQEIVMQGKWAAAHGSTTYGQDGAFKVSTACIFSLQAIPDPDFIFLKVRSANNYKIGTVHIPILKSKYFNEVPVPVVQSTLPPVTVTEPPIVITVQGPVVTQTVTTAAAAAAAVTTAPTETVTVSTDTTPAVTDTTPTDTTPEQDPATGPAATAPPTTDPGIIDPDPVGPGEGGGDPGDSDVPPGQTPSNPAWQVDPNWTWDVDPDDPGTTVDGDALRTQSSFQAKHTTVKKLYDGHRVLYFKGHSPSKHHGAVGRILIRTASITEKNGLKRNAVQILGEEANLSGTADKRYAKVQAKTVELIPPGKKHGKVFELKPLKISSWDGDHIFPGWEAEGSLVPGTRAKVVYEATDKHGKTTHVWLTTPPLHTTAHHHTASSHTAKAHTASFDSGPGAGLSLPSLA